MIILALGIISGCSGSDDFGTTTAEASGTTTAEAPTCDPELVTGSEPVERTFTSGGVERTYLLATPDDLDAGDPAPVLLNLHGFSSTAERQDANSRLSEKGTQRGYVVITPQALESTATGDPQTMWNVFAAYSEADIAASPTTAAGGPEPDDDLAFLNGLLDELDESGCVDPDRAYSVGMSNGAAMTAWMACQEQSRFAAVGFVAGINQIKQCPDDELPSWIAFHGDDDEANPYTGGDLSGFPLGLPTVPERAAEFAERVGCTGEPDRVEVADDVVLDVWDCPDDRAAELYTIEDGSHSWPGGADDTEGQTDSIDASELILDFFDDHPS